MIDLPGKPLEVLYLLLTALDLEYEQEVRLIFHDHLFCKSTWVESNSDPVVGVTSTCMTCGALVDLPPCGYWGY